MNDSLRTDDFLKRVSAISSPADDRKIYFALVRRDFVGLDDVYVVLSDGVAARLLLLALRDQAIGSQASVDLTCHFARCSTRVFAGSAERYLEARRL